MVPSATDIPPLAFAQGVVISASLPYRLTAPRGAASCVLAKAAKQCSFEVKVRLADSSTSVRLGGVTERRQTGVGGLATFERVLGKESVAFDPSWLRDLAARFDAVDLDIGTGDGRFVVDSAREQPNRLWIGLDPVADNMAKSARAASAKSKKGGLANALFVRGAAENLPGPFRGIADRISINYPWGSLLRILVTPDLEGLKQIAACGKPGTEIAIYLNYSTFEDRSYLERLGLDDVPDPATAAQILEGYAAAGFATPRRRLFSGDPPFRSQWGRQLVRGSHRKSLLLETCIAGS